MNTKYVSFTQKFDNLEISLRGEITTAADAEESAVALTHENKSVIDELKQGNCFPRVMSTIRKFTRCSKSRLNNDWI